MGNAHLLHHESVGAPPSAETLARDFSCAAGVARQSVRALYEAVTGNERPEAQDALDRWKRVIFGPTGHELRPASPAADALARAYGVPSGRLRPAELLFAVHTYYAVVVKLFAWQVVASSCGLSTRSTHSAPRSPMPADRLAQTSSSDGLRREIDRFETGGVVEDPNVVGLNLPGLLADGVFSWYTSAWERPIEQSIRQVAQRLAGYDAGAIPGRGVGSGDLLKPLYEGVVPRRVRHALGEYYTPDWLARHVLDEVGYRGEPHTRLLDPACGSGTFLVAAVNRIRAQHEAGEGWRNADPRELCRAILASVVGFDLNPLAVLSARVNYLIAVCDLAHGMDGVEIPVLFRDSILAPPDDGGLSGGRFDFVVGNPPWIAWDDLSAAYRHQTKPLWQRYGLFSLAASDARHGGGKKDLSMLMLYVAADRYLREKGRLGMVVTQTLFQTKGAGDGFRRFRLGANGAGLRVLRVDDLVDFRPFPQAANWTAAIVLEKGGETTYPVPYVKWSLSEEPEGRAAGRDGLLPRDRFRRRRYEAEPVDPGRPTSPWFLRPEGLETGRVQLVGPSDYQAHLGANTGGANGVYWVDVLGEAPGGVRVRNVTARGKRAVECVQEVIEPDLLYPLLRWADVARYHASPSPSTCLLLAQDVRTRRGIDEPVMLRRYPKTHAYLSRFAGLLTCRAAYRRYQGHAAFYSMYNVGEYTLAPVKVVWRRMDHRIRAAVVEEVDRPPLGRRPVVPQETCVLVAAESADEAHYLCAVVNSAVAGFLVASHSVRGGKGFGTPSMLHFVRLRQFDPQDPIHRKLACASRYAHRAACQGEDVAEIQHEIDRLAGRLWALSERELDAIRQEVEAGSI